MDDAFEPVRRPPARGRDGLAPMAVLALALAVASLGAGLSGPQRAPAGLNAPAGGPSAGAQAADVAGAALAISPDVEPIPDAAFEAPSRWAWNAAPSEAMLPPPADETAPATAPAPDASSERPRTVMTVPLPVSRPPELRRPGGADLQRRADRLAARRAPPPPPAAPVADERSFLEKLFGVERGPALAYAALESRPVDPSPRRPVSPPLAPPSASGGTAIYDIRARTVTLPSGERLEAHSGLGPAMDDPRQVHVRMRGATPPGTYDLTEREQPFHGVRAIRLTPVGGSEAIYGRVGLLAHTYMLGPSGASNGCVSFRDYDRFLQAYLRGEIQRLVVVPGAQDSLPSVADNAGPAVRLARNGG